MKKTPRKSGRKMKKTSRLLNSIKTNKRVKKRRKFGDNVPNESGNVMIAFAVTGNNGTVVGNLEPPPDPKRFREAHRGIYSGKWTTAEQVEIKAPEEFGVWKFVKKDEGMHPLPTKWVYKKKLKADGTGERYKARLVARGDKPVYGKNDFVIYGVKQYDSHTSSVPKYKAVIFQISRLRLPETTACC